MTPEQRRVFDALVSEDGCDDGCGENLFLGDDGIVFYVEEAPQSQSDIVRNVCHITDFFPGADKEILNKKISRVNRDWDSDIRLKV